MSAPHHTPHKRKNPCCLAAHTGWDSIAILQKRYTFWRLLQRPFENIFWLIHQRADRIQDQIEFRKFAETGIRSELP
jgi:hypothetical protein